MGAHCSLEWHLTLLQPHQLFLKHPLLPGQRLHMIEADDLQSLQSEAESGFSLPGILFLQVEQLMQWSPRVVSVHPLYGLETIKQVCPKYHKQPERARPRCWLDK